MCSEKMDKLISPGLLSLALVNLARYEIDDKKKIQKIQQSIPESLKFYSRLINRQLN